ncbi:ankyrin repeat protein [Colletotrichum plurivorum]|uniref:Ankyrin repeat protein n=1 Tax=Colletotrichum plurivorum TaxID=2175906 RepID=A0A8H6JZQ8_9PEZI|nr:ankyrin repeat protein [Colletotrichum plurivorum]
MDPSGIIGVVGQILAASVKLGLDWKEAPEDTKNFIGELEGLSKVLSETLSNVVKNPDFAAAFQGKHSSVLSSDSALLSICQKELDDLLGKIRKSGDGRRFGWERMKATFLNERTQTAVENLQRRCNMLNSMVAIDNIALSANTNLEVKSTRREIAEAQEITSLIQHTSSSFRKVYLVIDALDESTSDNGYCHDLLATILEDIRNICNVNLLATSRKIPEIEAYFENCNTIEIQAIDSDVSRYLDGHMSQLPSFVGKSCDLQEQIKTSIIQAVEGMFLLAKLQLESLTGKRTPKAVRTALTKLSTGSDAYDKAYNEAMERIHGQLADQKDLAQDSLSWIVCSKRPLTTSELQHALAIEKGTDDIDQENIPAIEDIVSVCAGLVTVDEESRIIRLVHYTTQEYFERTQNRWLPAAESLLAVSCVTYLSFDSLSSPCENSYELSKRRKQNPLLQYASESWGHHARAINGVCEEVLTFLQADQLRLEASLQTIEYKGYGSFRYPSNCLPSGLHLLAHFGDLQHTAAFLSTTEPQLRVNSRDSRGQTPLAFAVKSNEIEMIQFLLKLPGIETNGQCVDEEAPVALAARLGNEHSVGLLLASGDVNINTCDKRGRTPLTQAVSNGHVGVIKRLIETGKLDFSIRSRQGETSLLEAVNYGRIEVVMLLLETGKIDTNLPDYSGQTPLSAAMSLGIFKLLVEQGKADISSPANFYSGQTLLLQAASYGREDIMTYLMDTHAVDIEERDDSGYTALTLAVKSCSLDVVRYLVETAGAGVNSRSAKGRTLISIAALFGKLEVVKYLYEDCKADLDTRDSDGQTCLSLAAERGFAGIVEYLVETGKFDVNAPDGHGHTSLLKAVRCKSSEVVEYLLRADGIEQSLDTKIGGQTPLEYAMDEWSLGPDHEITKLLIAAEERFKGKAGGGTT